MANHTIFFIIWLQHLEIAIIFILVTAFSPPRNIMYKFQHNSNIIQHENVQMCMYNYNGLVPDILNPQKALSKEF